MNNKLLLVVLVMTLGATQVMADTFGGVEYGYTTNDNFNGATGSTAKLEENIASTTVYLGHFKPSADKRSAFIIKGKVQVNSFDKASQLDNTVYGISAGQFYKFSKRNSVTTTFGVRAKRFDDSRRDGEVYSLSASFKQKKSKRVWFREGLLLEHGEAEANSGVYNGYGVSGSVNMKLTSKTVINLGASWTRRIYDVTQADKRTGKQLSLGLVQQFNKSLYLRASAALLSNSANDGTDYDSNIYSVGMGLTF